MAAADVAFEPTPRQAELWRQIAAAPLGSLTIIGYGGAVGGGKTRAIAELAYDLAMEMPGVPGLVARRDLVDLRQTTLDTFDRCIPPDAVVRRLDSPFVARYLRDRSWPPGVTSPVYFRELKDWMSIASTEYGWALLDEAGEIPRDAVLMVLSRLRHPTAQKRVLAAASNPWPGWFEDWFIKGEVDKAALEMAGGNIRFIPSRIADNPYLPDNYESLLRAMYPADWIESLIEGNFGLVHGAVHDISQAQHLWAGDLPKFSRYVGGLDFGGQSPHDHMTAGVFAGVTAGGQQVAANTLIRLSHFEDRGPDVYERLLRWIGECEAAEGKRAQWVADKSQMWGIDQAVRIGVAIEPSHGGADSVVMGIGLQNRRFAERSSYFTAALLSPPSREAASRGARSWYERMSAYRWAPEKGGDTPAKREPIKVSDDTPNADRYMHEAVDAWPVYTGPIVGKRTLGGARLAQRAV